MRRSVEEFHKKKHVFIYNKDLSKGYFLRVDPARMQQITQRLHTFKEPRVVADDDKEYEIKER